MMRLGQCRRKTNKITTRMTQRHIKRMRRILRNRQRMDQMQWSRKINQRRRKKNNRTRTRKMIGQKEEA